MVHSPGTWKELAAAGGSGEQPLVPAIGGPQKTLLEQVTVTQAQANQELWEQVTKALCCGELGGVLHLLRVWYSLPFKCKKNDPCS